MGSGCRLRWRCRSGEFDDKGLLLHSPLSRGKGVSVSSGAKGLGVTKQLPPL